MRRVDPDGCAAIDAALGDWRQGDYVLGDHWFVYRIDPSSPLTDAAAVAAEQDVDNAEAEVAGFVVVSQTCDLVRACGERPFVEVCPLVEKTSSEMHSIARGRQPGFAVVAALSESCLVADLGRVMTTEKAVVASWERSAGCLTDDDTRRLALALARKRNRVAFPDDFNAFCKPLTARLSSKHDKGSDEGSALRALREIRVRAAPSWDASDVQLMFWFIPEGTDTTFAGEGWDHWLDSWMALIPVADRFTSVHGAVQTLDDLTARDYVESDRLDLDHLTARGKVD